MSSCPICESGRTRLSIDLVRALGRDFNVFKCRDCGVKFISPVPAPGQQRAYYSHPAYQSSSYFKHLKKGYEDSREMREYGELLELIEEKLRNLLGRGCMEQPALLDVGCSTGAFLNLARKRGWKVRGVDICADFVNYARSEFDLDVRCCSIEELDAQDQSYDAITFLDVLEHMANPLSALRKAYSLLKDHGLLVILTPNERSLIKLSAALLFRCSLGAIRLPVSVLYDVHHLFYFNLASLNAALKRTGFAPVHVEMRETILDRIIGPDSDHWIKQHRITVAGIRLIFFMSRLVGMQNKLLVVGRKQAHMAPVTVQESTQVCQTSRRARFPTRDAVHDPALRAWSAP